MSYACSKKYILWHSNLLRLPKIVGEFIHCQSMEVLLALKICSLFFGAQSENIFP